MWLLIIIVPLLVWLDFYLFKFFYSTIFSNQDDFDNSVKYSFRPGMFSLFKGEYLKDKFAEFKLSGFIFFCVIAVVIEILLIIGLMSFISNF